MRAAQLVLYGHRIGADGNVQIGVPLFVGQIYTNTRTITPGVSEKTLKAYDFLTVLARTEGTLVFTNSTMTDIVKWICGFYEIPMGRIVDTEVPVGQIIQGAGTSAAVHHRRSSHAHAATIWPQVLRACHRRQQRAGAAGAGLHRSAVGLG
jgi:hypothetical protein